MPKKTKHSKMRIISNTKNTPRKISVLSVFLRGFSSLSLLAFTFSIILPPTLNETHRWLGQDGIPRKKLDFTIDKIPAKWGYACWIGPFLDNPAKFGSIDNGPTNEIFRNLPPLLNRNIVDGPLNINRTLFSNGIGTHAPSKIAFSLQGKINRFSCKVGLDMTSDTNNNSYGVVFFLLADGREIYRSPKLKIDADPFPIDVPVAGVKELVLGVDNCEFNNTGSNPDWVDLKFYQ
jgi:hypothetical protein